MKCMIKRKQNHRGDGVLYYGKYICGKHWQEVGNLPREEIIKRLK